MDLTIVWISLMTEYRFNSSEETSGQIKKKITLRWLVVAGPTTCKSIDEPIFLKTKTNPFSKMPQAISEPDLDIFFMQFFLGTV